MALSLNDVVVSMENEVLSLEGFLPREFIGIVFGAALSALEVTPCDIAFSLLQHFVLRWTN